MTEKSNHSKVRELLRLEAAAIERAASRLRPDQIDRAIELLSCCDGKTIITGVGKSGVIGQKIAQTLTSTGTVSVFVHPSDALHGGLGIVAENDVVIAISNSGETDEILAILPALRARKAKLITIVGNLASTLARQSDVALDASVDKEACPLNLAPTTSTTVALAIGDALAMTLMEVKGMSAEDFAANHPAGRLGKRLTLRVKDLMHKNPAISPTANWIDVVRAISEYTLGAVTVIDGGGKLLGIITDGDLRRVIQRTSPEKLQHLTAEAMMTSSPVTSAHDSLAYEALQLMENRSSQISVLPVTNGDGRCVGLIRLHDIVRSGL